VGSALLCIETATCFADHIIYQEGDMKMKKIVVFLLAFLFLTGCAPGLETAQSSGSQGAVSPAVEEVSAGTLDWVAEQKARYDINSQGNVIYLAGGCFWGMQKYLQTIPGVEKTVVGYANGEWDKEVPITYEDVSTGLTGFRETVYVEYDPERVSLDTILFAYFYVIDPTVVDGQGADWGSEYQTGVYYTNDAAKETIDRIVEIEIQRYPNFVVEIEPLEVFYEAEEEHQHYLDKNPNGVCHISPGQIDWMNQIIVDPANYRRPEQAEIRERLTPLQYQVTQENYTEEPFNNEYWDHFEKGIYVDVVSGEPLFSSLDKFESPCGWPAFAKGIDVNTFFFTPDYSTGDVRTEVRSRAANSHLGHIFHGEPDSPTGNRYCINSAALRFIPYEEMEEQGYGYLMFLFDENVDKGYKSIAAQEAKALMDGGDVIIVDVREAHEYQEGHIPNAIALPISIIGPHSGELISAEKDSTILIYCRSGNRSKVAASYFVKMGHTNVYEFGGILDWPYEIVRD